MVGVDVDADGRFGDTEAEAEELARERDDDNEVRDEAGEENTFSVADEEWSTRAAARCCCCCCCSRSCWW